MNHPGYSAEGVTRRPHLKVSSSGPDDHDPPMAAPYLSVIVPAYKAAATLARALSALDESELPREDWELIVVNDGADDDTIEVATRWADAVVRLPGKPRGPSYARNRGSEVARGQVLVFLDADVCAHQNTLGKFASLFRGDPELAAAFGSYDAYPPAGGIVSKYRNLLHHFVHQRYSGDAETFWAGCGAIRADVFHDVGRYDEWHFARPQIEDIELGRRIRLRGHRISLQPEILATHLKSWTLKEVVVTDFMHRGVPWTRLLLHEGKGEGSSALNLSPIYRISAVLLGLAALLTVGALVFRSVIPLGLAALLTMIVIGFHMPFYLTVWKYAGPVVTLGAVPLHLYHHFANGFSAFAGWIMFNVVGPPQPPPDVIAFEEVGLDTWPPVPSRPNESVWYRHGE
jgi:GT2 family glycosyltransferase